MFIALIWLPWALSLRMWLSLCSWICFSRVSLRAAFYPNYFWVSSLRAASDYWVWYNWIWSSDLSVFNFSFSPVLKSAICFKSLISLWALKSSASLAPLSKRSLSISSHLDLRSTASSWILISLSCKVEVNLLISFYWSPLWSSWVLFKTSNWDLCFWSLSSNCWCFSFSACPTFPCQNSTSYFKLLFSCAKISLWTWTSWTWDLTISLMYWSFPTLYSFFSVPGEETNSDLGGVYKFTCLY